MIKFKVTKEKIKNAFAKYHPPHLGEAGGICDACAGLDNILTTLKGEPVKEKKEYHEFLGMGEIESTHPQPKIEEIKVLEDIGKATKMWQVNTEIKYLAYKLNELIRAWNEH